MRQGSTELCGSGIHLFSCVNVSRNNYWITVWLPPLQISKNCFSIHFTETKFFVLDLLIIYLRFSFANRVLKIQPIENRFGLLLNMLLRRWGKDQGLRKLRPIRNFRTLMRACLLGSRRKHDDWYF